MFNFKNTTTTSTPSATSSNGKTVNPASYAFYLNLCEQKGKDATHLSTATHAEVQATIEMLQKLPNFKPATLPQWDKINLYTNDLGLPTIEKKLSVTEASEMIQRLSTVWESKGFHERITAPMIEMLEKMSKCPDVPMFTIHIPEELLSIADNMQTEYNNILSGINASMPTHTITDLDEQEAKMIKFQSEMEDMAKEKSFASVKKSDAQAFIQAYKTVFYAWDNNRPSDAKINLLQTLFRRTGQEFEYDALRQYSNKEADALINQLQKEQSYDFTVGQEPNMPNVKRGVRSMEDILIAEQESFEAFIHSLSAVIGQQADPELIGTMSIKDMLELVVLASIYEKDAVQEMVNEIDFFKPEVVNELLLDAYYTIEEKELIKKLFKI